jgi:hypothetical protein
MEMSPNSIRFEFALSFAGAQRKTAKRIRDALVARDQRVFYDRDYEHEMLGRNGADYLRHVYSREAQYCIVLLSPEYDQGQWTALERESIDARKLRGDDGVLIPVRVEGYAPTWLPETRIYFDLTSRPVAELIEILLRLTAGREMALSSVTAQDDLYRALPGTTWRKRNGIEHVIFRNAGLFYNNHAGYPSWRENYYRIESAFGRMTLTWTVDNFTTACVFNKNFSKFTEVRNSEEGIWSLLSVKPDAPPWGI